MIERQNIALVMFQYSVVVKGIEKKLQDLGYHVEMVQDRFEKIADMAKNIDLFLLYLPNDIVDDEPKKLIFSNIIDAVLKAENNMVVIGEHKDHADLLAALSDLKKFEWIDRPVDMEKFGSIIRRNVGKKAAGKKRLLLVDDDPLYAKMVREWIKDDYKVDIVTAGMQAISFLLKVPEDEKVDMILLDYEMPVVDGPQVLQMLRQEPATENIPVTFLTGHGDRESVSRVMALKPAGYVLKTITRADLLKYLEDKLG